MALPTRTIFSISAIKEETILSIEDRPLLGVYIQCGVFSGQEGAESGQLQVILQDIKQL